MAASTLRIALNRALNGSYQLGICRREGHAVVEDWDIKGMPLSANSLAISHNAEASAFSSSPAMKHPGSFFAEPDVRQGRLP